MTKIFITLFLSCLTTYALTTGETPKEITLSGKNGGLVDGGAWHSSMLRDKVFVLFYVDPDKRADNDKFIEALHQKGYDRNRYGSVAIINLKATWLPNFVIERKLKAKQKKFPKTLYAKDKTKYLVKEWNLKDESANVIIFDKEGKVIYTHTGPFSKTQMQEAFALIERNL